MGSSSAIPVTQVEQKVIEEFVEYENKEIGFKFTYPKKWGNVDFVVDINDKDAGGGKSFYGNFTSNSSITFAGLSEDFGAGRAPAWPQTRGFIKEGNEYKQRTYKGNSPVPDADFVKVISNTNIEGLLLKGNGMPALSSLEKDQLVAIFNLDNKSFPGMGFLDRDPAKVTQSDFERLLSTFKQL